MADRVEKAVYAQQSLFEDFRTEEDATAIVRVEASDSDGMSPMWKRFNAQARKIEGLRRSIDDRMRAYNEILAHWGEELAPVEGKVADLQTRLAFALEAQAASFKLGVRRRETVGIAIVGLLDNAFGEFPPGKDAQKLFGR